MPANLSDISDSHLWGVSASTPCKVRYDHRFCHYKSSWVAHVERERAGRWGESVDSHFFLFLGACVDVPDMCSVFAFKLAFFHTNDEVISAIFLKVWRELL